MKYYEINEINDAAAFVKLVNGARLASKGQWYQITGEINGKSIAIKGYKTWLQIFRIRGIDNGNCPDLPVARFKESLTNTFNEVIA